MLFPRILATVCSALLNTFRADQAKCYVQVVNYFNFRSYLTENTLSPLQRQMANTYVGLHVKCPIFMFNFNQTWIRSTDFSKSPRYKIPVTILIRIVQKNHLPSKDEKHQQSTWLFQNWNRHNSQHLLLHQHMHETIFGIKLILKLLRHVSVLIHHLQGVYRLCELKLWIIKCRNTI